MLQQKQKVSPDGKSKLDRDLCSGAKRTVSRSRFVNLQPYNSVVLSRVREASTEISAGLALT